MNGPANCLSPAAAQRFAEWRDGGFLPAWARAALDELVHEGAWNELEDRFFRDLAFGTGGMRGRTIGRRPAKAELGPGGLASPAHPAVGSNNVNDLTMARAAVGLYRQVSRFGGKRLVIAYDVRHFSRRFAELVARVWRSSGGEVWLFDRPRSTPQLSFAVRALGADAGVVITASHNPPHDNGFKAYGRDGAQLIPPQADEVMKEVGTVRFADLAAHLSITDSVRIVGLNHIPAGARLERQYQDEVLAVAFDRALISAQRPRVAYTALHGTGGVVIPDLLQKAGTKVFEVAEQADFAAGFPTVKSPNPENPEALEKVVALAKAQRADVALATDPDADRLGSAFREADGTYRLLSGNQLGVLLADHRLRRARELGWVTEENISRAVILKSFVTTPLLDAVARGHGARCVNTLTGFKWMGAKMRRYDEIFFAKTAAGAPRNPAELAAQPARERAALRLRHSSWVVFATEESYGFLAGDAVRDKDGNAAALLCTELVASLKQHGLTASAALDALYLRHGYHRDELRTLTFEGAAGVEQIRRVLTSLRAQQPATLGGRPVGTVNDFLRGEIRDEDGDPVPPEDFLLYDLDGGWRLAVRGSGTEPKLKLYFFAREPAANPAALAELKRALEPRFAAWCAGVADEMRARAG